jgi:hypothetical protein
MGLCAECARLFRPPMCRECAAKSTIRASHPIVRRAIAALLLAIVGFIGFDYALTRLLATTPHFPPFATLRSWVIVHATAVNLIAGYALTAWPYGLKVTGKFNLPRGYLLPISWFYRLFEWRVVGGLVLGVFVFPFEVIDDIRTYFALRNLLDIAERVPEYVVDEPRRIRSSHPLRPELGHARPRELPTVPGTGDIIDQ